MTTFDERERGFEAKFVLDETQRFQAQARRDRMLGEWLGAQLGLSGVELETYARSVLKADLAHPGDDDIVAALVADATSHNLAVTEADIREKMSEFHAQAQAAVHAGS